MPRTYTWKDAVQDTHARRDGFAAKDRNARDKGQTRAQRISEAFAQAGDDTQAARAEFVRTVDDLMNGRLHTAIELESVRAAAQAQARDPAVRALARALEDTVDKVQPFFAEIEEKERASRVRELDELCWQALKFYAKPRAREAAILRALAENKSSILTLDSLSRDAGRAVTENDMNKLSRDLGRIYELSSFDQPVLSATVFGGLTFYGLREKGVVKGVEKFENLRKMMQEKGIWPRPRG